MELKETVDLMLSDDFKDRFNAEYNQLLNRYIGLNKMLSKMEKNELDFVPKSSYELLEKQFSFMGGYLVCLKERAKLEGIDLKIER